jgi:apolipoprotein N-acyltransferase
VLAIFGQQSAALTDLFSAATLLPCLIYLTTVVLYLVRRRRLPEAAGFSLGAWEIPVVGLALVWLVFELSIFRDGSFAVPWAYVGIMVALGLVYLAFMAVRRMGVFAPTAPGRDR